jgi:hypothetical protein
LSRACGFQGRKRSGDGVPSRPLSDILAGTRNRRFEGWDEKDRRSRSNPGVKREQIKDNTGWQVRYAEKVAETPAPSARELEVLRELHARTVRAHGEGTGVTA